jgi:hypothetical protein
MLPENHNMETMDDILASCWWKEHSDATHFPEKHELAHTPESYALSCPLAKHVLFKDRATPLSLSSPVL